MVLMVAPADKPLRPRGRRRRGADPVRTGLPAPGPATTTDSATDLARDLESRYPGWAILWRRWARRYWAFPLWLANAPGPVEARNVQDLLAQMNDVEVRHPYKAATPNPHMESFDGPRHVAGVNDSSSKFMTYTRSVRKDDAGRLDAR